jgi:hypothetical protein
MPNTGSGTEWQEWEALLQAFENEGDKMHAADQKLREVRRNKEHTVNDLVDEMRIKNKKWSKTRNKTQARGKQQESNEEPTFAEVFTTFSTCRGGGLRQSESFSTVQQSEMRMNSSPRLNNKPDRRLSARATFGTSDETTFAENVAMYNTGRTFRSNSRTSDERPMRYTSKCPDMDSPIHSASSREAKTVTEQLIASSKKQITAIKRRQKLAGAGWKTLGEWEDEVVERRELLAGAGFTPAPVPTISRYDRVNGIATQAEDWPMHLREYREGWK